MKDKTTDIIMAILVIIFGISLVLWAEDLTNFISIIIGILITLYGINKIINNFKYQEYSSNIIFGIISLVFGIFLIINSNFLKELISFIIGIYILLIGINSLITILKISKYSKTNYNKSIILTIIGIIIGFLCLIGKFIVPDFFLRFIGILIICFGIINLLNTIMIDKTIYMRKK